MLKFRWLIIIALLVTLLGTASPVFADNTPGSQEDPQVALQTFSGIALLSYYSSSLDYIIQLDQNGSDTNLEKMPFANVPQELDDATGGFASNGTVFTASIVDLFGLWNQQNTDIQQYRLNDAEALYAQITDQLPAARQQLSQIESSVENTGVYLKIASLPSTSGLTQEYNEVMAKIQQLFAMLDLLSRPLLPAQLIELLTSTGQQGTLTPGQIAALLTPTEFTLNINPSTAYVGDEVTFSGRLSSQGAPLPEREIILLVNNLNLLTEQTDAQGEFQGTFQLPYLYINQMSVQAIYYPQGNDAGVYLAATSPVIKMTVLFYNAKLTLQMSNPVYPGKEAIVTGTFDYSDAPVLIQRTAELYLDNALEKQFNASPVFNQGITLAGQITQGKHSIIISVPADGRYAPVIASYVLNVTLATTNIDLHLPVIGLIPGSIQLSGKLYSVVGPLANADVVITGGTTIKKVTTAADGTFSTKIGIGMGLSLLGTQGITVQVQPQEPWNAPLTSTKNIFLINYINFVLILIVLVVLAVYLPRRFKKWFTVQPGKRARLPGLALPAPSPVYQNKTEIHLKPQETANSIFYWYHVALKLVQNITKVMLKPHQTLREYGKEANLALGPVGKYFMELTYLLEKRLYGKRQPDIGDVQKSQELALEIQKQAGREQ